VKHWQCALGDDMSTEIIDHTTLVKMAEAGIALSAHAIGRDDGWAILIRYGDNERLLALQRSHQVRIFRKLDTVADCLKGAGITTFEVDTAYGSAPAGRRDRAAAIEGAHTAAAYTRWLKLEVQAALDDTHVLVAHDKAMRQVRAALKARPA
jgi:hypothetical protein